MKLTGKVGGFERTIKVLPGDIYCSRRCHWFSPVALPDDSWDEPSTADCDLFNMKLVPSGKNYKGKKFKRCNDCSKIEWVKE